MASEHTARGKRAVTKRARPRQTTALQLTTEQAVKGKLSAGDKFTGDCPACGSEGALGFGCMARNWVKCFSCRAEGLTPGDELRALADAVGAPSASY